MPALGRAQLLMRCVQEVPFPRVQQPGAEACTSALDGSRTPKLFSPCYSRYIDGAIPALSRFLKFRKSLRGRIQIRENAAMMMWIGDCEMQANKWHKMTLDLIFNDPVLTKRIWRIAVVSTGTADTEFYNQMLQYTKTPAFFPNSVFLFRIFFTINIVFFLPWALICWAL
jgi:hypothetical protein